MVPKLHSINRAVYATKAVFMILQFSVDSALLAMLEHYKIAMQSNFCHCIKILQKF